MAASLVHNDQLIGVATVGAWLVLIASLALLVRARWPEQSEWSRKVIHIGAGPVVLLAWVLQIERWIAIPAAAAITLAAAVNHRIRLLPGLEDVDRPSYGTVAYGLSITLLLLFYWPDQPAAVCAGVLVMAFGDGLAGLLGTMVVSPSWTLLGQRRSLVGTASMALASLAVLMALATQAQAPGLMTMVGIASVATVLEQVAIGGVDNLTVPIGVAWLWSVGSTA